MDLSAFDFDLPEPLIALRPAQPREAARLLVVHSDGRLEDARIADLPARIGVRDHLVFNETRVLPAALRGIRPARGEDGADVAVDVNLIERAGPAHWKALARPGRRLRPGDRLDFSEELSAVLLDRSQEGGFVLQFDREGDALDAALEATGYMPLPPYIARRRPADARDRQDYQTAFATGEAVSVAAPTAGLHFTPALLAAIDATGAHRHTVRLDVGAGTFAPLRDSHLARGRLHAEHCHLSADTAARLNAARDAGDTLTAVGTTALRTLETACDSSGRFCAFDGQTEIFLRPGDCIRGADRLLTNFHLPQSSLFMLVCAFMGTDIMQRAYQHAIATGYRFYSYGDACLLIRNG